MAFDLRRAQPTRPGLVTSFIAGVGGLFVLLAILVGTKAAFLIDFDDDLSQRAFDISSGNDRFVDVLIAMETIFDATARLTVLGLVAAYAWWRRERRIAIWIVVATLVSLLTNPLLKHVFDRDRPSWDDPLHTIGGFSFPSGHSTGAGMFCTVLILLTIVLTGRGWKRRVLIAFWVILGLAIAGSRVFVGVHYPSDALAGICFGSFIALITWKLIVGASARHPHQAAAITGSGLKRVAVIYNPIKVGDIAVFKDRVAAVAAREGWNEPQWWETTIEDPGEGQAREALEAGVDLIIAAGGDGTVRFVCEEAARTGIAVGILPHGTGNLLARNLGIPLNTRDALDVAFSGQDRAIDLGTYTTDSGTDTCFLVMAGLGMDAMIMNGVDDQLKSKVGWLAYFVSGVKAARYPAMKVQISVDDGEFKKFKARTVVIGNVGFLQGGIPLLPDAQIDDGTLDVVVLAPKRFIGWLAIIVRVVGRQKRTNERLDRLTGHKVVIRAEKPMPMQLDGDPAGEGREITAEVQPGVLLVRVPVALAPAQF